MTETTDDGPCWSCEDGEGCPADCECDCPLCLPKQIYFAGMTREEIEKFAQDVGLM